MKFPNKKILLLLILLLVLLGVVSAVENSATKVPFANFQNSPLNTKSQTVENSQMALSTPTFSYATTTIAFPNGVVVVQIADTTEKETQGLSGRSGLPEGTGMIFVFDSAGPQYMWMKDMNFSLDMVWLDQNKNVTYIATDVTPQSYEKNPPEVFFSPTPASYVIELPANYTLRLGIKLGDKLNFDLTK